MSYIKAVQTIADDQTEVASKTQALIDEEGVDSSEIKSFNVEPWGANKFIILLLYGMLREVRKLSSKFGLKIVTPSKKLAFKRTLSVKAGLLSSFREVTNDVGQVFSSKIGILLSMPFKLATKMSTKAGLKASSPIYAIKGKRISTTKLGMGVFWVAWLNGVQIELYP